MALPPLRDELSLFSGPPSSTGAPTWTLYDPVRNLYFRIDWPTFEILCRWGAASIEDICNSVNRETSLTLEPTVVESVMEFLIQRDLIKRPTAEDTQRIDREYQRRRQSWYKKLLHSYLFFRVPLLKPDAWIGRTLPMVRWLGGSAFRIMTFVALIAGLMLVGRQWDSFTTSLVDLFSLKGLMAYGITLVVIKFVHELGHAYTAKNFGCRVPTMGVAFLVLFPMAYTDVNDVWRLADKSKRMKVGAAGILTELSISAWATLFWSLVPDGPLRTGLFLLATTTWISTIAINASPFLRFDGYFLLMDALDMPNLHSRCFAIGRWRIREFLFGLGDPQPEPLSISMKRFLQAFAVGTWLYRLIVFGGIAILVYAMFPKPLGPILAFIEIYWFIAKPILGELAVWKMRWSDIVRKGRTQLTLSVLGLFLALFFAAWDPRVTSQAVLTSSVIRPVISVQSAQVSEISVKNGQQVNEGARLIRLQSPDLISQMSAVEAKIEGLKKTLILAEMNEDSRSQLAIMRSKLQQAEAERGGLQEKLISLDVLASTSGEIIWFDIDLQPGDWIKGRQSLAVIRQTGSAQVVGFVRQDALKRVSVGDRALFVDEVGRLAPIALEVAKIDTDATRVLSEPMLASTHGGEILVRQSSEQPTPEDSIYKVTLKPLDVVDLESVPDLRGQLTIYGEPEAWSTSYYRSFMALLQREAAF